MGTVYAKSVDQDADKESVRKSDRIDLQSLKAQVQRVHVAGIGRTKEDIIISSVKDVFSANNFQSVVLKIHEARSRLEELGCFKGVDVLIDTYEGSDALTDGIQVTFEVEEVKVLGAQANTAVGQNEALFNGGAALRNILGRGEHCTVSYGRGTKKTTAFAVTAVKPIHDRFRSRVTSSVHQSSLEAGWSGYKLLERGAALGVTFNTTPTTSHELTAEAAWRHLSCLSKTTAFGVREHSGHTLKTSIRYCVSVDTRDQHIFPTRGHLLRAQTEAAGYGGNVGFSKSELQLQANQALAGELSFDVVSAGELPFDVVTQVSLSLGHLAPLGSKGFTIADRFFMGGPTTFRGFQMGGVGPHSDKCALGAQSYWLGSAHAYAPLPLLPRGSFVDRFRLHAWASAGTLADPAAGGADAAANLAARMSLGAGVAVNVGGVARVELNYCVPVRHRPWDKTQPGLQLGIAADVL
ncbi:sorting and assembly machinery component 50 homolog A [Hyalella azteca]|uniref:Sorting and assembly machinery component 50 homolog A n=1 Tax=Hyalella azteca TaxID=294128 RepID=A0A8B7NFH3_HYAAZ|nr:sorting and assembly machinery component 50 homolog A [Hyalella azteca]